MQEDQENEKIDLGATFQLQHNSPYSEGRDGPKSIVGQYST